MYRFRSSVFLALLALTTLGSASAAQTQVLGARDGRGDQTYPRQHDRQSRTRFDRHNDFQHDWQLWGCYDRREDARRQADRLEKKGYEVRIKLKYDDNGSKYQHVKYCVWYKFAEDLDRSRNALPRSRR